LSLASAKRKQRPKKQDTPSTRDNRLRLESHPMIFILSSMPLETQCKKKFGRTWKILIIENENINSTFKLRTED